MEKSISHGFFKFSKRLLACEAGMAGWQKERVGGKMNFCPPALGGGWVYVTEGDAQV